MTLEKEIIFIWLYKR